MNPDTLKRHIREWSRLVDLHGPEVLKHKVFNKVWTPEEKLELVSKVIAGTPRTKVAIEAGINPECFINGYTNINYKDIMD